MNDKDHLVGQLTTTSPLYFLALSIKAKISFSVSAKGKYRVGSGDVYVSKK